MWVFGSTWKVTFIATTQCLVILAKLSIDVAEYENFIIAKNAPLVRDKMWVFIFRRTQGLCIDTHWFNNNNDIDIRWLVIPYGWSSILETTNIFHCKCYASFSLAHCCTLIPIKYVATRLFCEVTLPKSLLSDKAITSTLFYCSSFATNTDQVMLYWLHSLVISGYSSNQ